MRRLASVVAATLAVVAAFVPSAHAAVVQSRCYADTYDDGGGVYSGTLYAYAFFDDQATHSLLCYVSGGGSTPTGTGTRYVVTYGPVTYYTSTPDMCLEIDGVLVSCGSFAPKTRPGPPAQCNDGIDNDLDRYTDGSDRDCGPSNGASEGLPGSAPACRDGIDNDLDGRTDSADYECTYNPDGTSESAPSGPCTTVALPPVCVSYTTGSVYQTFAISGPGTTSLPVKGYLQAYDVPSPTGGTLTVPCVVLTGGPDPCAALGGHPRGDLPPTSLVDTSVPVPTGTLTVPLATVRVCNATLTLKVDVYGVSSQPAYALC